MQNVHIAFKIAHTRLYTFLHAFARFGEKVGVSTVNILMKFLVSQLHERMGCFSCML